MTSSLVAAALAYALALIATLSACPAKYDCSSLIAGWHPDVPAKVINSCRDAKK